jgi:hypothetical protein
VEWLPYFVLGNGKTVAEQVIPSLANAGTIPPHKLLGMDA